MTPLRRSGTSRSRAVSTSVWYLAGTATVLAAVEWSILVEHNPDHRFAASLFPLVGLLHVAMGLVARWRRPSNAVGGVLVLGGLLWMVSGLSNVPFALPAALGQVTATVPLAVVVHLVLVYPTGRTGVPGSRVAIGVAYVSTLLLQAPSYLFAPDGTGAVLHLWPAPAVVEAASALRFGTLSGAASRPHCSWPAATVARRRPRGARCSPSPATASSRSRSPSSPPASSPRWPASTP